MALLDAAARAPASKPGQGDTLTLDLFPAVGNVFPAVTLTATRERVEPTASGRGLIWNGQVQGVPMSQVTLVAEDGVLVGNVRQQGQMYAIRFVGNGTHAIYQLNQALYPPEHDPFGDHEHGAAAYPPTPPQARVRATADDASTIDVMVLYTPAARTAAGGALAMNNLVNLGISESNTSYANSGITQRVRLVHSAEIAYTEAADDIGTDLDRLIATADGHLDTVHTLRNQYGADIVSLWTAYQRGGCGIASLMTSVSNSFESRAFNVTVYDCAVDNLSFPH
jgi:hypothetical protein